MRSCIFISILFLSTALTVRAQKPTLKLYVNGNYSYKENYTYYNSSYVRLYSEVSSFDFGMISFAWETNNNKYFSREIEIMPIDLHLNEDVSILEDTSNEYENQITSGAKISQLNSMLRYQLNYSFCKEKTVQPYIGVSSKLFYSLKKINPKVTIQYPYSEQSLGVLIDVIPGIKINLGEKIGLDLNIPFGLFDISINRIFNKNPIIPKKDQLTYPLKSTFIPKSKNLRIGVFYRL